MHRDGSDTGNAAGCSLAVSGLKSHIPEHPAINSDLGMSVIPGQSFFHVSLYKMIMPSNGVLMCGAEADNQLPHAVRVCIVRSVQIASAWYLNPSISAMEMMLATGEHRCPCMDRDR